ncbi:MAG: rhodanese-like domain-containing protein [Pseudomonadota bacterium]|nr:rhodanese-like domain-containing protein [Pseudomonadota bacterium]
MNQTSTSEPATGRRGDKKGYAGDVDVVAVWAALRENQAAVLVDVRTKAEWNFVGIPDLSDVGKKPKLVEWQSYPTMEMNGSFINAVTAEIPDKSTSIYLLCRSGARSKAAAIAMTEIGYNACFNVSDGFEGAHDVQQHRGQTSGWKAQGLPWVQG